MCESKDRIVDEMGLLRRVRSILRLKLVRITILFLLCYWCYSYYFSEQTSFSSQSKKFYHNKEYEEKVQEIKHGDAKRVSDNRGGIEDYLYKELFLKEQYEGEEILKPIKESKNIQGNENNVLELPPNPKQVSEIFIIITFANAHSNQQLQGKFRLTVSSLLKHHSVPVAIHIIGDQKSQKIAADIIKESYIPGTPAYRMVDLDVDNLAEELDDIVKPMRKHFSYQKPGAYYSHALFFLSIAMHRVMPDTMHRVIMLDADLKFRDDIKKLHDMFDDFKEDNIIGIAREMQPVYRHAYWQYRNKHPSTRVGAPPPNGLTGFNSGVLLLHLDKMRKSTLYNSQLTSGAVQKLTDEYMFKGHLGDQDFFTLLSMNYESLFHILPCEWNRQLCHWWRENGYRDVFDLYYSCDTDIKIYHGNCGMPIPTD